MGDVVPSAGAQLRDGAGDPLGAARVRPPPPGARSAMKGAVRILVGTAAFGLVVGAIYWFISYEAAGTTLLLALGIAPLILAAYAERDRRRTGADTSPLPEDLPDAGAEDSAGEDVGSFPAESAWPIALAGASVLVLGGIVYGPALLVIGLLGGTVAVMGLMRESRGGDPQALRFPLEPAGGGPVDLHSERPGGRMVVDASEARADAIRRVAGDGRQHDDQGSRDPVDRLHRHVEERGEHVVRAHERQDRDEREAGRADAASYRRVPRLVEQVVRAVVAGDAPLDERPGGEDREEDAGEHHAREERLPDRVAEEMELPVRRDAQRSLEPAE